MKSLGPQQFATQNFKRTLLRAFNHPIEQPKWIERRQYKPTSGQFLSHIRFNDCLKPIN